MRTAVEQAVDALRLWSNDWNEFDKTGENKPKSIEEVIAPFIQMEKEQMVDFARKCLEKAKDLDVLTAFLNTEHYYNETFKQQEQ